MRQYIYDTEENIRFLKQNAKDLLIFGRRFPSPQGSSYYLGDEGLPMTERPRETWITSRMTHVYSIGYMMGDERSKILAAAAIDGLRGELKDKANGGWYAGIDRNGNPLPDKQCYAHAFVILAASSAYLAGIEGAKDLLMEALEVYDQKFWDNAEGMAVDTWNTEFTVLSDYRGLNANMHSVEAFLAVADALDDKYRERAGRIIDRVIGWASSNDYRIPEHFTKDWQPDLDMNKGDLTTPSSPMVRPPDTE